MDDTPSNNTPPNSSPDTRPEGSPEELIEAQDTFVAAWGQMAGAWGISRTMAEVHALLYITGDALNTDEIMDRLRISRGNASMSIRALLDWGIAAEPMSADDIMDRLSISRGNASMSLRSLVEWGIVSRTHKRGERREFFVAEQDIWTMFRMIVRERIRREVDPLLTSLFELRDLTGTRSGRSGEDQLREHNDRIDSLTSFFQIIQVLGERFASPSGEGLDSAAKLLTDTLLSDVQSQTNDDA